MTAKDYRAINYVAQANGYKLALCQYPYIFFDFNGETVRMKVTECVKAYDRSLIEESRAKRHVV